jgi:hypothetical protein
MFASMHKADHLGKAIEARPLHRSQWIRLEERRHSFGQLSESPDAELLAITVNHGDLAATEERSKLLEEGDIPLMLYHAKFWKDLPANFHRGLPVDADEETSPPRQRNRPPTPDSGFPADCLHRSDCHSCSEYRRIHQVSQHIARCTHRHC